MALGERIKEIRVKKGIKQKELAGKAGISVNALINYEKNKRTPSVVTINKIAEALGTSPLSLAYGEAANYIQYEDDVIPPAFQGVIDTIKQFKQNIDDDKKAIEVMNKFINAILETLQANNIPYAIKEYHGGQPTIIEVTYDNTHITLDTDDLINIYKTAKKSFNNTVTDLIDFARHYK